MGKEAAVLSAPKSVATPLNPTQDVAVAIAAVTKQAAEDGKPLTGVEVAEKIHAALPPAPPAGQPYLMRQKQLLGKDGRPLPPDPGRVVVSEDGTIEDAIRAYNATAGDGAEIKTADTLIITLAS